MKTGYLQLHCHSPLAPYAAEYIEQKRALGAKCRGDVEILNMFDDFCINYGLSEPVLPQQYSILGVKNVRTKMERHTVSGFSWSDSLPNFLQITVLACRQSFCHCRKRIKHFSRIFLPTMKSGDFLRQLTRQNRAPTMAGSLSHISSCLCFFGCCTAVDCVSEKH